MVPVAWIATKKTYPGLASVHDATKPSIPSWWQLTLRVLAMLDRAAWTRRVLLAVALANVAGAMTPTGPERSSR